MTLYFNFFLLTGGLEKIDNPFLVIKKQEFLHQGSYNLTFQVPHKLEHGGKADNDFISVYREHGEATSV